MASTALLQQWGSTVLNGSGNGTVALGPTGSGEVWTSVNAAVHCSSNSSEATCQLFVGSSASSQFFSGGTTWGSTGDSGNWVGAPIPVGQQVFAVWTGGTPGATAYLTLSGSRQVA
jgi:hypothetical protein